MEVDKDYAVDIMRTMYQFSRDKLFTDFKLRAGGRTAHCHQGIISAKSSYFHALCSSGVREAMLDNPISKEEDSQVLDAVVQFLYLGNCNITTHNVTSLLLAADFAKLTELKNKCGQYMATKLTTGNLLTYHKLAKQTRLSELCDECMHLSQNNFSEVARSDWILSLTTEELHDFLGDDELNVKDEDEVLAVLERYLKHCQEASAVLEQIFPCVKIQFCSPATLEAMSKNAAVMPLLRLKVLEYLQHGLHGEGTARPSYSATCRARCGRGGLGKLPPTAAPIASTSASGSPSKPGVSAAGKYSSLTGPTAIPHRLSKPLTSAALPTNDQYEILIIGGFKTGGVRHPNIVFLDNEPDTSISTTGTILADYIFPSVCASRNTVIVSGGYDPYTKISVSRVQLYNINGNIWTELPDLPHPVDHHGSALVDGKLYSIGGTFKDKDKTGRQDEEKRRYRTIHKLDLKTATWSRCQGLPAEVESPGVTTVDEDILVIGGDTNNGYSTQTCRYNTATNKMITCQPMPRKDYVYRSTVAVGNNVYVLSRTQFLSYDIRVDQWSQLSMPMKPSTSQSLVLKQHTLIAMGGFHEHWKKPNDRVQVYDIRNKKWNLEDRTMPLELTFHWAFVVKPRK